MSESELIAEVLNNPYLTDEYKAELKKRQKKVN